MNRKSNTIRTFFKKQGFYIGLGVCVLAAGVVSFLSLTTETPQSSPSQSQGQAVVKQKAESLQQAATPSPTIQPSASPSVEPSSGKSGSAKKIMLQMPLDGEIIKAFSGDALVYNQTLNMWITHNGIDIASGENSQVCAALAGEVRGVYMDETRGMIVEIAHAQDQETRYVGLAKVDVEVGSKVNAGQAIGTTGTPGFEAAEGNHLHFEYLIKGEYQDPVDRMKTK